MDTKPTISNYLVVILPAVLAVFVIFFLVMPKVREGRVVVTNFDECESAGNPVMESYPRQCRHDGVTYVEDIETNSDDADNTVDGENDSGVGEENTDYGNQSGGILPFDSGVKGMVLMGPICPVQQYPPESGCEDKPYQTELKVLSSDRSSSIPFVTGGSDEKGRYKFMLPPGEYTIVAVGEGPLPSCPDTDITIEPGVIQDIDISCDTGIR